MHYTYKGLICIPLIADTLSFSSSISYENENVKEFHKSFEENEKKANQDLMNFNYYPFLQELNFS